ncbi:MAG: hypothetical protein ACTJG2_04150 [Candidatus Saccharimonadales bacterium]
MQQPSQQQPGGPVPMPQQMPQGQGPQQQMPGPMPQGQPRPQQQIPGGYSPASQYGRPQGGPPQQPGPNQQMPPGAQGNPANQQTPTPAPRPKNTTQNSLMFSEIRDNMLIMADGSFRAVIACKSINFDLMSSQEREGVEYSYQNFINSLTHPVQILIRSQRVDIGPYLTRLTNIRKNQDNMLLGVLMDDYIDFIEILSEEANIMDKSFYVVIPYATVGDLSTIKDAGKGFFAKMFGGGSGPSVTKIDKITYQKAKDEIKNRVDSVTGGLFQIGVHCAQLDSKQLGELYYNYYNPDTAVREPLGNFEQNTFTYVKKGAGEPPVRMNGGMN